MTNLTAQESEEMFTLMLTGKMPELDIEDFLVTLRDKGESADEILGAARAMRALAINPFFPSPSPSRKREGNSVASPPLAGGIEGGVLDVCGTGGDGLSTLNISTAVALVVASCGVKVAKHGNKAVSSKSGSSDVLTELGLKLDANTLEETNFAYFHAPNYHTGMKFVSAVRAKLKTRTTFNLLGPLCNPALPERQLLGVYDASLLPTFAKVLRELGSKKAWIVHGDGGLDEISLSGATQVAELDKGAIDMFEVTPQDFGFEPQPLEAIKGGCSKHNAQKMLDLFSGEKSAYRDIVLMNAAAALLVAEKVQNLHDGVAMAADAIDSGKAKNIVDRLSNIVNR